MVHCRRVQMAGPNKLTGITTLMRRLLNIVMRFPTISPSCLCHAVVCPEVEVWAIMTNVFSQSNYCSFLVSFVADVWYNQPFREALRFPCVFRDRC